MQPTITWLLERRHLRLSLVDPDVPDSQALAAAHNERLTAPINWVHSSDLDDPTPFLNSGNVLLTDGMQFGLDDLAESYDYDSYVARLIAAGILGLGLATHFLHQGMPAGLARACARAGLPLIDVPDRVPFIAVIREVADQIAVEGNRRKEWSISAHRAISRAALKPNGLRSIVIELERQLSCWVGLFDMTGNPLAVPFQRHSDERYAAPVRAEVAEALRKGRRSSTSLTLRSGKVTIQTLGHSGNLRGALALGREVPFDRAENELVTSVVALATLALEQNRELEATRAHLRTALLELLLADKMNEATTGAAGLGTKLPATPVSVLVFARDTRSHYVLDALALITIDSEGSVFFGVRGDYVVILAEPGDGVEAVSELVSRHALSVGGAAAASYEQLKSAFERATDALLATHGKPGITDFNTLAEAGMLGALHAANTEHLARQILAPLSEFDEKNSTALVEAVRTWLAHNCSWGATATSLGVHRHTARSRIDQAAGILNLDLESLDGRLEVWAALRMLD